MYGLLMAFTVATAPVPMPTAHFQITFVRTETGYTAECAAGCGWTELEFHCGADCHAVIDDSGVRVGATTKEGDHDFAFVFHRTADGFQLVSLAGTNWVDLAWSCGLLPCAAHVNESGVSGSAVGG